MKDYFYINRQITEKEWFKKDTWALWLLLSLIIREKISSRTDAVIMTQTQMECKYGKHWRQIRKSLSALEKEGDVTIARMGRVMAIRVTSDCIKFE